jgi:hypothetical protein
MKNINKLLILLTLTFMNDRSVSMENENTSSLDSLSEISENPHIEDQEEQNEKEIEGLKLNYKYINVILLKSSIRNIIEDCKKKLNDVFQDTHFIPEGRLYQLDKIQDKISSINPKKEEEVELAEKSLKVELNIVKNLQNELKKDLDAKKHKIEQ